MLRQLPRAFALATIAALLSACSSMPDWSKPGSWLDTAAGGGAETSAEAKTAPPPPSAGDKPPVVPAQTASTASQPSSATPQAKVLPTQHASAATTEYPNLANQQELQSPGTTESQRREIRDSLVADRDKAQHSADELRGGTVAPAAPPAPVKPADTAPPADGTATPAPTN
jgi:hypothetical protein